MPREGRQRREKEGKGQGGTYMHFLIKSKMFPCLFPDWKNRSAFSSRRAASSHVLLSECRGGRSRYWYLAWRSLEMLFLNSSESGKKKRCNGGLNKFLMPWNIKVVLWVAYMLCSIFLWCACVVHVCCIYVYDVVYVWCYVVYVCVMFVWCCICLMCVCMMFLWSEWVVCACVVYVCAVFVVFMYAVCSICVYVCVVGWSLSNDSWARHQPGHRRQSVQAVACVFDLICSDRYKMESQTHFDFHFPHG